METVVAQQILSRHFLDKDQHVVDEIVEWIGSRPDVQERLNEDILRIAFKQFEYDVSGKGHVCGLQGFGMELYDYCVPCTKAAASRTSWQGSPEAELFKAGLEQLLFSRDQGVYSLVLVLREDKVSSLKKRYGLN